VSSCRLEPAPQGFETLAAAPEGEMFERLGVQCEQPLRRRPSGVRLTAGTKDGKS
jgi:hypothetical protein